VVDSLFRNTTCDRCEKSLTVAHAGAINLYPSHIILK